MAGTCEHVHSSWETMNGAGLLVICRAEQPCLAFLRCCSHGDVNHREIYWMSLESLEISPGHVESLQDACIDFHVVGKLLRLLLAPWLP